MSYDVSTFITVSENGDRKKIDVQMHDVITQGIARIIEIRKLIDAELGGVGGWIAAGDSGRIRFSIKHHISDAEFPMIKASFYSVDEAAFKSALVPVWKFKRATLPRRVEDINNEDETVLFARAWALDTCTALFMRSVRSYANEQGWEYDTEISRDLRYRNAWISEEEASK